MELFATDAATLSPDEEPIGFALTTVTGDPGAPGFSGYTHSFDYDFAGLSLGEDYWLHARVVAWDHKPTSPDPGSDAVGWVTGPVKTLDTATAIPTTSAAPTIASFGREDGFIPEAHVDRLEAGFARSGQRFQIDRYAGAGHAFLNRTRPEAYYAEASAAAWTRVVPFLREALGA
ncbi:MAG: dienelactone hydrolase family protein [Myxococcota bacterium]